MRTFRSAILLALLIALTAWSAKADDITFTGGSGGLVGFADNTSTTNFAFQLQNGPLNSLMINGAPITFSGVLNISATGDTTDSSGDPVFDAGTLTITSGSNTEVTASLLDGALTVVNGTPTFLGVLDPSTVTFGDLLSGEGQLVEGLGVTQFQIVLPVVDSPVVGFLGAESGAGVAMVTPEPSVLILLAVGLTALLLKKFVS